MSQPRFIEKFWAKVRLGDPADCWPWMGFRKPTGHGLTQLNSTSIHAHRKAWILINGPIRDGLCVNHRCDNAACCNPAHMYLGTRADNMVDRWANTPEHKRTFGRKRMLDDAQLEKLWKMRSKGKKLRECAAELDVHIATICRYITAVRKVKLAKLRADRLSHLRRSL